MALIEASATFNKSAEEIFAHITNLENQKKMSSYITAIEVQGPMQVGHQIQDHHQQQRHEH